MEPWRRMEADDRGEFLGWFQRESWDRWLLGEEKYNSKTLGFQGDPLDHAIEEALDIVFYLWMAKRKQGSGQK